MFSWGKKTSNYLMSKPTLFMNFPKRQSFFWAFMKNKTFSRDLPRLFKEFLNISNTCYLCLTSIHSDNFTSCWKSKHVLPFKKCVKLQKHHIQSLNKTKQNKPKIFMNFQITWNPQICIYEATGILAICEMWHAVCFTSRQNKYKIVRGLWKP